MNEFLKTPNKDGWWIRWTYYKHNNSWDAEIFYLDELCFEKSWENHSGDKGIFYSPIASPPLPTNRERPLHIELVENCVRQAENGFKEQDTRKTLSYIISSLKRLHNSIEILDKRLNDG